MKRNVMMVVLAGMVAMASFAQGAEDYFYGMKLGSDWNTVYSGFYDSPWSCGESYLTYRLEDDGAMVTFKFDHWGQLYEVDTVLARIGWNDAQARLGREYGEPTVFTPDLVGWFFGDGSVVRIVRKPEGVVLQAYSLFAGME